MVGKVLLHKFLIRVCRVGLSKVLLEYHVLVALEKFPLIYWQPFGLLPLLKTKKKKYNFDQNYNWQTDLSFESHIHTISNVS